MSNLNISCSDDLDTRDLKDLELQLEAEGFFDELESTKDPAEQDVTRQIELKDNQDLEDLEMQLEAEGFFEEEESDELLAEQELRLEAEA